LSAGERAAPSGIDSSKVYFVRLFRWSHGDNQLSSKIVFRVYGLTLASANEIVETFLEVHTSAASKTVKITSGISDDSHPAGAAPN
jgi:hypothetical protein